HLPGAINIPAEELARRLGELPPGRDIVAYCRGPYCVLSTEAVAALQARGFHARRLGAGFPEWKAGGLQVDLAPARAGTRPGAPRGGPRRPGGASGAGWASPLPGPGRAGRRPPAH